MIALIAAVAANNIIGDSNNKENGLPWHLPDELKYFRATTKGSTVVMGRTTFEAIGRPLPKRRNIVLTRQTGYEADSVEVMHTIEDVLQAVIADEKVFILGGADIWQQFIEQDLLDALYVTYVKKDMQGDVFFPAIDMSQWKLETCTSHSADELHECSFDMCVYSRSKN